MYKRQVCAVGGDFRSGINCLLVTVSGTVVWGMSGSPTGFYHSFVLEHGPPEANGKATHHVVSASLRTRLLEDSNDAAASAGNKKKRR